MQGYYDLIRWRKCNDFVIVNHNRNLFPQTFIESAIALHVKHATLIVTKPNLTVTIARTYKKRFWPMTTMSQNEKPKKTKFIVTKIRLEFEIWIEFILFASNFDVFSFTSPTNFYICVVFDCD